MTQSSLPTLNGQHVRLRAPIAEDWAGRFALGNTPEIHRLFGGSPAHFRELSEDAAKSWVESQMGERYAWIIEHDSRLIGSIRLHTVNALDHRATMAVGILDPHSLGKGYGADAMRLVARHAFGPLGLHRLALRVLEFNTRAIAAYEKVGFVKEGRERQTAYIDDVWFDDVIMGLLSTEFEIGAAA
ncbi:GNAT family protein [uncultured Litoreibacter sp.]|uniref:GNAT family N-acetyltransferase n=1 Tax=uncultured Litoreibacter sp. TaxID=1392394 RepID=UPI002613C9E3|nr:GNAT family protein [uncultured Litoreibacter sp.]